LDYRAIKVHLKQLQAGISCLKRSHAAGFLQPYELCVILWFQAESPQHENHQPQLLRAPGAPVAVRQLAGGWKSHLPCGARKMR
jgi:hypothetical protein